MFKLHYNDKKVVALQLVSGKKFEPETNPTIDMLKQRIPNLEKEKTITMPTNIEDIKKDYEFVLLEKKHPYNDYVTLMWEPKPGQSRIVKRKQKKYPMGVSVKVKTIINTTCELNEKLEKQIETYNRMLMEEWAENVLSTLTPEQKNLYNHFLELMELPTNERLNYIYDKFNISEEHLPKEVFDHFSFGLNGWELKREKGMFKPIDVTTVDLDWYTDTYKVITR